MAFVVGSNGFIGAHMRAIEEPGVICMAGISDTTCEDGRLLQAVNVALPLQLATDAAQAGLPFVYASSASVYGNEGRPLNRYAKSKSDLDEIARAWPSLPRWYGLRFFNVYGPGEGHKGRQASIIWRLKYGTLTEVFEPQTRRDFVHVHDCVDIARWLLRALPPSGIYDVGTGTARSIDEAIVLTGARVEIVPMPDSLKGKYQLHTQADPAPLRARGYDRRFLSLEEGVSGL